MNEVHASTYPTATGVVGFVAQLGVGQEFETVEEAREYAKAQARTAFGNDVTVIWDVGEPS